MERHRAVRSWGLRGWLLAVAALPTLLTLLAMGAMELGMADRLHREAEERARLVAGALAEASEFGLISGNPAALDRSVRELLARDGSIASIDILDASRRPFVSLPGRAVPAGLPAVELPVRSSVPDIDFFDRATPHVSLGEDLQPSFRLGPVAGHVRVTMSLDALRRARWQRLGLELAVVAAAGLAGLLAAALLARRMRGSLLTQLDALQALRQGRYAIPEGPALGGELWQLQRAVLELADALGAAAQAGPATEQAPQPPFMAHLEAGGERGDIAHRLLGRLEAALLAVRLAAAQAARETDPQAAARTGARVVALADQAQAAGEALVAPLRPRIIEGLGLPAALEEVLQACRRAQPACAFDLDLPAGFDCNDLPQAAEVHRVVSLALARVVGHARATRVRVRLQPAEPSSRDVQVLVEDDGAGESSPGSTARLAQLRESLAAGGSLVEVRPQTAAAGTVIAVTVRAGAVSRRG